jgi:XTP/dITP diphosphohydrolase
MEIIFVTTNPGKMGEAREIGAEFGIEFVQNGYDTRELQSMDPLEIAEDSARDAYAKLGKPLIVEDSGMFIDALKGFPGPFSAYAYKCIGLAGILRLMEGEDERSASMKSAVAYVDGDIVKSFLGEARGTMPESARGEQGFGYDPIFIPEGREKTFAEDTEYKNIVSHRAQSLRAFCDWYQKRFL